MALLARGDAGPGRSSSTSVAEELARQVKAVNVSRIESPCRETKAMIVARTAVSPDQDPVLL
jgi:hypothetical protein